MEDNKVPITINFVCLGYGADLTPSATYGTSIPAEEIDQYTAMDLINKVIEQCFPKSELCCIGVAEDEKVGDTYSFSISGSSIAEEGKRKPRIRATTVYVSDGSLERQAEQEAKRIALEQEKAEKERIDHLRKMYNFCKNNCKDFTIKANFTKDQAYYLKDFANIIRDNEKRAALMLDLELRNYIELNSFKEWIDRSTEK